MFSIHLRLHSLVNDFWVEKCVNLPNLRPPKLPLRPSATFASSSVNFVRFIMFSVKLRLHSLVNDFWVEKGVDLPNLRPPELLFRPSVTFAFYSANFSKKKQNRKK